MKKYKINYFESKQGSPFLVLSTALYVYCLPVVLIIFIKKYRTGRKIQIIYADQKTKILWKF